MVVENVLEIETNHDDRSASYSKSYYFYIKYSIVVRALSLGS